MYFFGVTLLLIRLASIVLTRNTINFPKPYYDPRKINGDLDDYKNCFCYPEGPLPTVRDLLDSQDHGLERMIVYLYKNVMSNEIKIYIPSPEKQVRIPDIPFESGDGFITATTETVSGIFSNSPYRVKIYNSTFDTIDVTVDDSLAIGLNVGSIETVSPDIDINITPEYDEVKINEGTIDMHKKENVKIVNINEPQVKPEIIYIENANTIKAVPEVQYSNKNFENADKYLMSNNYPYIIKPQVAQDVSTNNGKLDLNRFTLHNNYESQKYPSDSQATARDNNDVLFTNRYMTFDIWFNHQLKKFQSIHGLHEIRTIDSNVLRIQVQRILYENNIYISSDGAIIDSTKGTIIDAANLQLRPVLLGDAIKYKILRNIPQLVTLPKHLPYLEGILVILVTPPQILGIIPLGKTYLPETTYNLGKSLSELAAINRSNNFFNRYGASSYPEARRSQTSYYGVNGGDYYQNGPKLPPTYSNADSNYYKEPESGASKVPPSPYWSSEPYSSVTQLPHVTTSWNPWLNTPPFAGRRKASDPKIKHHLFSPPKNRKNAKGRSMNSESSGTKDDLSESGRRSVAGFMKTLLSFLDDLPSKSSTASNSTEVNVVNESKNIDDGPDFRIIGGNAATGSGTPLNNKGRSGYHEK